MSKDRTFSESTERITRIVHLQGRLLDYSGHVRRGLSRDDTKALISEINFLRGRQGWHPLDMTGRWKPRGIPERTE